MWQLLWSEIRYNRWQLLAWCTIIPAAFFYDSYEGDIAILPISKDVKRFLLCQINSLTLDAEFQADEVASEYPIPEDLLEDRGQRFNWTPISFSEETQDYIYQQLEEEGLSSKAFPRDAILGTVLRLSRALSY